MRVVGFAPDLMDQSKLKAAGVEVIRSVAQLDGIDADRVLVDLSRPGVLDVVPSIDGEVIGFGPHVDDELLDAGRAAGCADVLPRSVFFRRLAELAAGDS